MKIMFLDESGDHNLETIDPQYPVFVLAGVVLDKDCAENVLPAKLTQFKKKLFGHSGIVLHTADITRNRNGFEQLKEPEFRHLFYTEINALIDSIKFKVIACAIKKDEHLKRYSISAIDPYMLSLHILVERFCFELGNTTDSGLIVAERRGPTFDHELELAFLNLKIQGTRFLQGSQIEKRIVGLNMRKKSENIAGLQLADLVATPIGRHIIGKKDHKDYRIIESKFRQDKKGCHEGYGLVVLPKA
jgi:hypothetical protein